METELKFVLLPEASPSLAQVLAQTPLLRKRKATQLQDHVARVLVQRTRWSVGLQASRVAVVLDCPAAQADGLPLAGCVLTLQLQDGQAPALFAVARQLARHVSMLPLLAPLGERPESLSSQTACVAVCAAPVPLTPSMSLMQVAGASLSEMFGQFTTNLRYLRVTDDPEVLHQARVAWRRFKSALQLFKRHPSLPAPPERAPLRALSDAMTTLRDVDVALAHTLPMLAHAYTGGDALRRKQWRSMELALTAAAARQRAAVLDALQAPAVGVCLIEWWQWLSVQLPLDRSVDAVKPKDAGVWLTRRLLRWREQLLREPVKARDPAVQHRVRLLSKRLRYCVEALRPLLPKGRSKRWLQWAIGLQEQIGAERDIACAVDIVSGLHVEAGIVHFLRGVAFGRHLLAHG